MPNNADGSVIIKANVDVDQAEKDLEKLKKKASQTEREIEDMGKARFELTEKSKELAGALDAAKAKLFEMQQAAKGAFNPQEISDQSEIVKSLQFRYNAVQSQVERYDRNIVDATRKLERQTEEAGELVKQINSVSSASRAMARAQEKAEKSVQRFGLRLREVVRSALIFTLITQALAKLRGWVGNVIESNEEARASVARLKGALLTLAQPLVDVLVPAFIYLADLLSTVIYFFATLFAAAQGKTIEQASEAAKNLNEEIEAIEGVGNAAKSASKSLASFDEINKLSAQSSNSYIAPDFSNISLPEWMRDLTVDLAVKIGELRFSWDEDKLLQNKDFWITAMSGLLFAVIGASFAGFTGAAIGLTFGVLIGLTLSSFTDKTDSPAKYKELFLVALAGILGAVLGGMFAGFAGGAVGAAIGIVLGIAIVINSVEFQAGNGVKWNEDKTWVVVMSAILGAILGGVFFSFTGGIVGLALGALISFVAIEFGGEDFNTNEAKANLRVALIAVLGAVFGAMFGGLTGAIIGISLGLVIGFSSVAFDKEMEESVRSKAKTSLLLVMTTIIGALIGAVFGGGVFGGIVGGVIGLTLGVAITLTLDSVKKSEVDKFFDKYSNVGSIGVGFNSSSYSMRSFDIPQLATGAVIPPNREFMAVLGDNKKETEVVSPLSTMKQAMLEALRESGASGRGNTTIVFEGELAALARILRPYIEDEGRRVGVSLVTK